MIVVGCGKAKLARSAPAEDLYTGSLFRAARRYAEASGEPWVILSGKHGVVLPSVEVTPYDARAPEEWGDLAVWAWEAALAIDERIARYSRRRTAEILAGARYARPVADMLSRLGIVVTEPLAGLGVGYRLQKLAVMTAEKLHSARPKEGAAEGKAR